MSTVSRICRNTGIEVSECFCVDCIHDEMPPLWQTDTPEVESSNYNMTVQYVREQINLMTLTVRKANRVTMERGTRNSKQPAKQINGIPRLELKDLSIDKKRLLIEWAGDPKEVGVNADWAVVSVKLKAVASGVKRIYTMGDNNPCLDCLEAAFGQDETRWIGKEVFAWTAVEGIQEKVFVRFAGIDPNGAEIPFDYKRDNASGASAGGSF